MRRILCALTVWTHSTHFLLSFLLAAQYGKYEKCRSLRDVNFVYCAPSGIVILTVHSEHIDVQDKKWRELTVILRQSCTFYSLHTQNGRKKVLLYRVCFSCHDKRCCILAPLDVVSLTYGRPAEHELFELLISIHCLYVNIRFSPTPSHILHFLRHRVL